MRKRLLAAGIIILLMISACTKKDISEDILTANDNQETDSAENLSAEERFNKFVNDTTFYGNPEGRYILCDVTGDGNDDYCTSAMYGSGMVRVLCLVYDAANDCEYVLDGYNYDYYVTGAEDGKLIVEEKGPNGYGDPVITRSGTVVIEEGRLVFIRELDEKDLREFGYFKDEWIKEAIKDIIITSDLKVEYVQWLDDEHTGFRIGIGYKYKQENMESGHKEDYYIYKDGTKTPVVE